MRVAVCSDLHLEFGTISLHNTDNADVLVLSGDICVVNDVLHKNETGSTLAYNPKSETIHTFFQEVCERFPNVIYLMGNHEHYHGDFATSVATLRDRLGYLDNLHILDKEVMTIGDVTFIAGTLWTDMNQEDTATLKSIASFMNDYRIIKNSNHPPVIINGGHYNENNEWVTDPWGTHTGPAKFKPEDSVADHKAMLDVIRNAVDGKTGKFVVCGHHSPSKQSTKPQYEHDVLVNGAYSSDLNEFILDRPQIKLWTHGHTHHVFNYMIGATRIICNPRGYDGYEEQAEYFKLITVEI
jgi:predicted phosphodiesterase